MTRLAARAAAAAAALTTASLTAAARADNDGVYGRLDGDVDVRAGAGVAFASGGPSFAASAALVYLQTGGAYLHYADALGADGRATRRSISSGVHLQPLFLARYATDAERGPAHLDLILDSLAIEVGAVWQAQLGNSFDPEPGLELGLSMGVPILPRASGPFVDICAALRWRGGDLRGPGQADILDRGAIFSITVGWHQIVPLHVVDPGDSVRR